MDDQWLNNLSQNTALVVPTRSLANELNERVALLRTGQGETVWEAPNILVWSDYVQMLWHLNRDLFTANNLVTSSQASVLWTQIIEASRRSESDLALLNVQQTVKAVQRSWKLMHEWCIDATTIANDHVADSEQFVEWLTTYKNLLDKRGLLDQSLLLKQLKNSTNLGEHDIDYPFKELIMVSYDLLNAAQNDHLETAKKFGVRVRHQHPQHNCESQDFVCYSNAVGEIRAALEHARACLERDPNHRLSLVVPDLQHRRNQVQELARDVFYPSMSPLDVTNNNPVYRFSLGQALTELAPIEVAMRLIALLKNKVSMLELSFVLRSRYLGLHSEHAIELREFEQWLARQRMHSLLFDQLPALYLQCLEQADPDDGADHGSGFLLQLQGLVEFRKACQQSLSDAKQASRYAALSFAQWAKIITDWLAAWGWRTQVDAAQMTSLEHQLLNRWNGVLEEFASLASVQGRAGLNRALELLRQISQNTVFLPKGVAAPLVITGLLEAIGREVDTCIVTGLHQDFPAPSRQDAFISKRFLMQAGHPEVSAETSFVHAQKVMNNLLACARHRVISYSSISEANQEITMQASPLFRNQEFIAAAENVTVQSNDAGVLESYSDTQGPAWLEPGRARGGSRIFENQSNCAFKAFATHQLGFYREDEVEFGLDGMDRGNIVHHLLDRLWQQLQTQEQLLRLDHNGKTELVENVIETTLNDGKLSLNSEKSTLLKHEKKRLERLLLDWLEVEASRPTPFSVVEREERREGQIAGIRFSYVIDRVDLTNDGRSVIVDYKTGTVNRNDWLGERLKSPQMPLYALALDKEKRTPTSGVAYAQLKQGESKFIELSETDVFRKETKNTKKNAEQWSQNRESWPAIFEQLAEDFLVGHALVNPIDKTTCQYCELHSLCRVSQLRAKTSEGAAND